MDIKKRFQLLGEKACDLLPKSWISSPRKHFCKANQAIKVQVNRISKTQRMKSRIKNEGTKSPSKFYSNIPRYDLQYQRGRSSSSGVLTLIKKINIQIALINALETLCSIPCFHSKSAVSGARERSFLWSMALGVNKRHCNITGSFGGWKTFMVVGEPSWMHQSPAFSWSSNRAVVAQKPAASSLRDTDQETHQLG